MKKTLILLALLLFCICIFATISGIIFYKLTNNSSKFTLIKESGTVMYKEDADDSYKKINSEEIELETGNYIKTESNSFAQAILPDNSIISIDQSTELQITFEKDATSIEQFVGNTWHRVKNLTGDKTYEVKTPNTIAAVRGTIFAVDVSNDTNSAIHVQESMVDVSNYELINNKIEVIDTVELTKNDYVESTGNKRLTVMDIPESLQNSDWYTRNRKLDEVLDLDDFNIKDFRNLLNNDQNNNNSETGESEITPRFDLPGMDSDTVFDNDYDYTSLCTSIDTSYFTDEYWELYGSFYSNEYVNLLKDYFDALAISCQDGDIDNSEWQDLLGILEQFETVDYAPN